MPRLRSRWSEGGILCDRGLIWQPFARREEALQGHSALLYHIFPFLHRDALCNSVLLYHTLTFAEAVRRLSEPFQVGNT